MLKIVRHTLAALLILLILPLILWLTNWQWQVGDGMTDLYFLFFLTETVSPPLGFVTTLIMTVVLLYCLRLRGREMVYLLTIVFTLLLSGQLIKTVVKNTVQESRPYIVWLQKSAPLNEQGLYHAISPMEKKTLKQQIQAQHLPRWLKQHWLSEIGFAFPSGHTMFAVSWVLLAVGLLWPRGYYKTVILLMMWATGVMSSRLFLGMHWPRDLIAASWLSWMLVIVAIWLIQRCCPSVLSAQDNETVISENNN